MIHAGNGTNFIYANDTVNYVWTGTNPHTVVHAHEGSGVIHCENPHIVVFTSHHALPHYRLRRLPADQLLLGRLLTRRRPRPTPARCGAQMLTVRMPTAS